MKRWGILLAIALLSACGGGGSAPAPSGGGTGIVTPPSGPDLTPEITVYNTVPGQPFNAPPKTDYWSAPRTTDPATLDTLNEKGRYRNPSVYGTFALPSGNGDYTERRTHFDADCNQKEPLSELQQTAAKRLLETTETRGDATVWTYDFPALATDFIAKAPYASSYSQAINIHGLLFLHCKTKDTRYLDLAIKAGRAFSIPIRKGGVLNDTDGEYWFEELIAPSGYNAYIFNAHVYSINVLYLLAQVSGDQSFKATADKGVASLNHLLPLFDTGEWSKYDLRPPSPNIYVELHTDKADAVQKISAVYNGEFYTLCQSGCSQVLASARADNAFRFNINLPALREYHADAPSVRLNVEVSGPVTTTWESLSMKPVGGDVLFPQPDAVLSLNEMGWGQTQVAYQVWHRFLMNDLYSWTGAPGHKAVADRMGDQLAAFQAAQ